MGLCRDILCRSILFILMVMVMMLIIVRGVITVINSGHRLSDLSSRVVCSIAHRLCLLLRLVVRALWRIMRRLLGLLRRTSGILNKIANRLGLFRLGLFDNLLRGCGCGISVWCCGLVLSACHEDEVYSSSDADNEKKPDCVSACAQEAR